MDHVSSLSASNASSATSSGRNKVALKPGHSLMDWIKYTHSGQDLTSTGGKCLQVTARELSKHSTRNDAWIALKGKVYNITPYLDYHPGGEDELMRGAGKDATDLFNQIHRWVNAESMLQKCYVGVLKKSWSLDGPRLPLINPIKKPKNTKFTVASAPSVSPTAEKQGLISGDKFEWHIVSSLNSQSGETSFRLNEMDNKMLLKVISSIMKHKEMIVDLEKENLFIKLNSDSSTKWLNIKLPCIMSEDYQVNFSETKVEDDTLEISFNEKDKFFCNCSKPKLLWTLSDKNNKSTFWLSKLINKSPVNYNTHLFTFLLPSNVRMWVPVGHHVFVRSDIEGMEIVRSYTPVISSLDISHENDLSDGCHIVLMIKIYPSGALTPIINMCNVGDSVFISNYAGSFSEVSLERFDSIVMIAAGTGITPMIKIIHWALNAKDKKRPLLLLYFNKTEDDILWKAEFDNCSKNWENFQVIHILSKSNLKWNGFTGTISESILIKLLPTELSDNIQIVICGPLPFTYSALEILENIGYQQKNIHAFTG